MCAFWQIKGRCVCCYFRTFRHLGKVFFPAEEKLSVCLRAERERPFPGKNLLTQFHFHPKMTWAGFGADLTKPIFLRKLDIEEIFCFTTKAKAPQAPCRKLDRCNGIFIFLCQLKWASFLPSPLLTHLNTDKWQVAVSVKLTALETSEEDLKAQLSYIIILVIRFSLL